MSFVAEGQTTPQWSVPCARVCAGAPSAFSTAGVVLWTPRGPVRCTVSRERINRVTPNTLRTLREPRDHRELVGVLVATGARQV